MKRRNVTEVGKMRRPIKRSKIPEGFYGSTLLYVRFVVLWALVILADFILEFRFEFLWPFYLLLRSVYDSYRYQGLAFAAFFICVALASDMLCFCLIPVHWLLFAASTYVWVQYVWHTEKGVCAPTVVLWMLFVYVEAAVRLRDLKHMPGHLDLCRPFAAHCIGYPVVTLGFGCKSYLGYRMRQRKQRDVAKENDFYVQLMQQALPSHAPPADMQQPVAKAVSAAPAAPPPPRSARMPNGHLPNGVPSNGLHHAAARHRKSERSAAAGSHGDGDEHATAAATTTPPAPPTMNGSAHKQPKSERQQSQANAGRLGNGVAHGAATVAAEEAAVDAGRRNRRKEVADRDAREQQEVAQRLEAEAKRLRQELQGSRASEQELRLQVAALTTGEKVMRGDMLGLQRELEELQSKLQSAHATKAQDKQAMNGLERRLADERRARASVEAQLSQERKCRKAEEARAAQAQSARTGDCSDACRQRRRDIDVEISSLRVSQTWLDNESKAKEREIGALAEKLREAEHLLAGMQDKSQHLENSLSAETRIKLDLFSALGEVKRQLEIKDSCLRAQEKEIEELKGKIAQVLAVMPDTFVGNPSPSSQMSRVRLPAADNSPGSTLDPNATAYTPKGSLVTSTEA